MRTLFDAMKSNLRGVDKRVWDHCAIYASDCWNRLEHTYKDLPQYDGRSPLSVLDERVGRNSSKSSKDVLRRFGCLVYFRDQGPKTKLLPKWYRGIHLGLCPSSNGYLVGTYSVDVKGNEFWGTYSTMDVKFRESVLVSNLEDLRPSSKGIYIHYNKLDALESGESSPFLPSPGVTANHAQRSGSLGTGHGDSEP